MSDAEYTISEEDESPWPHYGFPATGDPRCFQPDAQVNTPAEMQAWEDDLAAVERGERIPHPRLGTAWGRVGESGLVHIDTSRWGLGTTICTGEDVEVDTD